MKSLYIGMDVHKHFTVAVAIDDGGRIMSKERIDHGACVLTAPWEGYFRQFSQWDRPRVAVEATAVSYAVLEAIEPYCSPVLSNPIKTRLIAEQRVKTDKIDAEVLAQLLRTEFLPTVHVLSGHVRSQRELLRHRMSIVRIQTGIKNRIHGMLTRVGLSYAGTDLYGKDGRKYLAGLALKDCFRQELDRYLRMLDMLAAEIKGLTAQIHKDIEVCDDAMLLTSIFGIGKYLAALIYWEIGDINRFKSPSKLVGYCGLAPRVFSTGGKTFLGPITKQGNKFIRWALVEAAQKYGARRGPIGDHYRKVLWRSGSKAARVAVARKLLTIIWHMLKDRKPFDPARLVAGKRRKILDEAAVLVPGR